MWKPSTLKKVIEGKIIFFNWKNWRAGEGKKKDLKIKRRKWIKNSWNLEYFSEAIILEENLPSWAGNTKSRLLEI